MKECVLVTGGAGFIGSNIVEGLLKENYKVKVIDNLSTGNIENIKNYLNKIDFYNIDIIDFPSLKEIMNKVDYIIHNAALPSVVRSFKDPHSTINVNIIGTLNIIKGAIENKVKKIIFSSSSSVYGNVKKLPMKEIDCPNPLSPYAMSKLACENLLKIYSNLSNIETVSFRYFNVFGPKQNPLSEYAAVIPKFINNILNNKNIVIYGDGFQSRDFTFVENVVYANLLALNKELPKNVVINIACGESYNLHDLVKIISNKLNKEPIIIYQPPREGDIKNSLADIKLAKELLGYEPKIKFYDGIIKTIEWFENIRTSSS